MDTLELIRITDINVAAQATELGQRYTDWMAAAYAEEYDHEVPSHMVNHIPHRTEDGELILADRGRLYLGNADGQPAVRPFENPERLQRFGAVSKGTVITMLDLGQINFASSKAGQWALPCSYTFAC